MSAPAVPAPHAPAGIAVCVTVPPTVIADVAALLDGLADQLQRTSVRQRVAEYGECGAAIAALAAVSAAVPPGAPRSIT